MDQDILLTKVTILIQILTSQRKDHIPIIHSTEFETFHFLNINKIDDTQKIDIKALRSWEKH